MDVKAGTDNSNPNVPIPATKTLGGTGPLVTSPTTGAQESQNPTLDIQDKNQAKALASSQLDPNSTQIHFAQRDQAGPAVIFDPQIIMRVKQKLPDVNPDVIEKAFKVLNSANPELVLSAMNSLTKFDAKQGAAFLRFMAEATPNQADKLLKALATHDPEQVKSTINELASEIQNMSIVGHPVLNKVMTPFQEEMTKNLKGTTVVALDMTSQSKINAQLKVCKEEMKGISQGINSLKNLPQQAHIQAEVHKIQDLLEQAMKCTNADEFAQCYAQLGKQLDALYDGLDKTITDKTPTRVQEDIFNIQDDIDDVHDVLEKTKGLSERRDHDAMVGIYGLQGAIGRQFNNIQKDMAKLEQLHSEPKTPEQQQQIDLLKSRLDRNGVVVVEKGGVLGYRYNWTNAMDLHQLAKIVPPENSAPASFDQMKQILDTRKTEGVGQVAQDSLNKLSKEIDTKKQEIETKTQQANQALANEKDPEKRQKIQDLIAKLNISIKDLQNQKDQLNNACHDKDMLHFQLQHAINVMSHTKWDTGNPPKRIEYDPALGELAESRKFLLQHGIAVTEVKDSSGKSNCQFTYTGKGLGGKKLDKGSGFGLSISDDLAGKPLDIWTMRNAISVAIATDKNEMLASRVDADSVSQQQQLSDAVKAVQDNPDDAGARTRLEGLMQHYQIPVSDKIDVNVLTAMGHIDELTRVNQAPQIVQLHQQLDDIGPDIQELDKLLKESDKVKNDSETLKQIREQPVQNRNELSPANQQHLDDLYLRYHVQPSGNYEADLQRLNDALDKANKEVTAKGKDALDRAQQKVDKLPESPQKQALENHLNKSWQEFKNNFLKTGQNTGHSIQELNNMLQAMDKGTFDPTADYSAKTAGVRIATGSASGSPEISATEPAITANPGGQDSETGVLQSARNFLRNLFNPDTTIQNRGSESSANEEAHQQQSLEIKQEVQQDQQRKVLVDKADREHDERLAAAEQADEWRQEVGLKDKDLVTKAHDEAVASPDATRERTRQEQQLRQ